MLACNKQFLCCAAGPTPAFFLGNLIPITRSGGIYNAFAKWKAEFGDMYMVIAMLKLAHETHSSTWAIFQFCTDLLSQRLTNF